MNKISTVFAMLGLAAANKKKIAAVGDSITEGVCSSDEKKFSYPVQLANMLTNGDGDADWEVSNFGVGGRTMLKKGDWPYWNE
jgi:lysophospholipase L1-like esterase